MPVTIKDVAALAGVSPSTVSRTCKDHPSISRQTKEKVRQAMAKLGYEPNFQASSLATQNSRTVGIILPPSEWEAYQNPFYLEMIRGISQYCNQKQYINTVITGQNEDEILQAIKTMARTGLAEGFIVLYSREQDPVLDYLYEEGLLYVLIGKACRNVNQTIYVDNDNVLAGREAAEYLLNLGHVRIACLSGDHSLLYNHDRKMGYMLALAERGIPFDSQLCVEVPSVPEEQDQALAALFAREDRPWWQPKSLFPTTWWSGRAAREPEGSAVIEIREQYNTSQAGDCLGAFLLSDLSPGSAGISANYLIFLKYILSYTSS